MRKSVRAVAAVLGAVALAVVTAACGGGSASEQKLPGVREFGLTDEEFVAHVDKVQRLIAVCMDRAGFEYLPVDVATIEKAQQSVRQEPGLTRRQYKERWGLSVTTRFDDPVRTVGLGPNAQVIERLPEPERVAYELTLFGENPDSDFAFTLDEEDFSSTGGCTREAVAQVFTPEQLEGTYVNPKDVLVSEDPRIKEAERNWTQCMHDHGYDYQADQDAIIEDFEQRLTALLQGDDPESLTGSRLEQLRAMQAQEIQASLADLDCQERFTDAVYRQVEEEVFGRPVSG